MSLTLLNNYISLIIYGKIISLAKNEVLAAIHEATKNVDPNASADVASAALMSYFTNLSSNPLDTAKQAIKNEASLMLPK